MTRPRSDLIVPETTLFYHCIARCVRRAFLCGDDSYSGKNFDHRKPWVLERLTLLTNVFAIDVAAYAVMSNHYHLVLHINKNKSDSWDKDSVVRHWLQLYKGPQIIHRYLSGEHLSESESYLVDSLVANWRERLTSISQFMACLNEYIARRANQEDDCKGRFWEGRFKSQALVDEAALLSCMAYVDLNPVRSGIADNPTNSDFTSIQDRLLSAANAKQPVKKPYLMPMSGSTKQGINTIPINLKDYLALVEWTAVNIRTKRKRYIGYSNPQILSEFSLTPEQWMLLSTEIQKQAINMLHGLDCLERLERQRLGRAA